MATDVQTLFTKSMDTSELSSKQKRVLQQSLVLFSEKGFERTSTSDIATAAGVSEGTVYKQFKTKDGILAAILSPFVQEVIPKMADEFLDDLRHTSYAKLSDFLTFIVSDRLTFAYRNRQQLRIFLQELIPHPELFTVTSARLTNMTQELITPIFENYQRTKQLVVWPSGRITRYIVGVILSYVLPLLFSNEPQFNVTGITHEIVEFLVRGLRP